MNVHKGMIIKIESGVAVCRFHDSYGVKFDAAFRKNDFIQACQNDVKVGAIVEWTIKTDGATYLRTIDSGVLRRCN